MTKKKKKKKLSLVVSNKDDTSLLRIFMENGIKEYLKMQQPITIRKRPIEVQAIQWNGENEPHVRRFIADDDLIHFSGNVIQVWSLTEKQWLDCPIFHYIIKGIKGEFYPCSPEVFKLSYDIVE